MSDERTNRIRASDAEREQVAAVLRQAMGEGRLSLAEGEERLAQAYAVTYQDELPSITADLPPPQPESAGRGGREQSREHGRWGGREHGRGPGRWPGRRGRPRIGLAVAAVAATLWAVLGSGPVWLAIVLGILAVIAVKHSWLGHGYGHGCGPGQRTEEDPRHYGRAEAV